MKSKYSVLILFSLAIIAALSNAIAAQPASELPFLHPLFSDHLVLQLPSHSSVDRAPSHCDAAGPNSAVQMAAMQPGERYARVMGRFFRCGLFLWPRTV